ncbi:hypothetical protein TRFO_31282 [Tritrichomonas foetus]|uniref:Leucine Rich Repeat family protein n=1 Tax=Tritrichomonas foetus TaxID=1144522 RepID=A0A1J4JTL3_9EUKA|nr:hypothetical protein TRFO_31282 [Tritrichomonas foetus]|eukprot:OHT01768.1 hypothetical protein TRFO_31282 [Tritrichomonas foetus]
MNSNSLTKRVLRAPYEFERVGPLAKPPAGHKPDFSLSVNRPPQHRSSSQNNLTVTKSIRHKRAVTLDTLFLVDILHTSNFEKCEEIDGSSQNLNAIDLTAIRQLLSIRKADFSDNSLPLEPFAVLPSLEELDLSCNSIRSFDYKSSESMTGDDRAWASLHTLNLSFNNCGKILSDLQLIPLLADLNLSNNSLSSLPSNLMHFTCLTDLNLSNNNLNSDASIFSLATIPSLRNLNLDGNNIIHFPKFQFGFEALSKLSIKNNKIEMPSDIESLLDLNIEEVNIIGNPIILRPANLSEIRQKFATSNITLICDAPPPAVKRALAGPLRTIAFDPLTLPSFTKAHIRALNRKKVVLEGMDTTIGNLSCLSGKQSQNSMDKNPKSQNDQKSQKHQTATIIQDDDVFMTAFGSKADDEPRNLDIDPTPLPEPDEDIEITSVWAEVPVVQLERRQKLTSKKRQEFMKAFSQLQFIVSHPDLRLKPRESPSMEPEETDMPVEEEVPDIIQGKKPVVVKNKKKAVATKLAARTEYTKTEIQSMLSSMQERLSSVERDLQVADESGQTAVEIALDQKNFASLHKQYETIRAELINTLNS